MKKSLVSFAETFIIGLFLSFLIMLFVGQSLEITGDSMYPTLKDNQRIIVEKVSYKSGVPKRGEIVVFRSFDNANVFLIKRVIAIPGDTFKMIGGKVYVNGSPLAENYLSQGAETESADDLMPYAVSPLPEKYYLVLGDNRAESYDSRAFGLAPLENFLGKAFIVYWPLGSVKRVNLL